MLLSKGAEQLTNMLRPYGTGVIIHVFFDYQCCVPTGQCTH